MKKTKELLIDFRKNHVPALVIGGVNVERRNEYNHRCFIESVITLSFMCWFGSLSVRNRNVLCRVVNVCSKVVGERQAQLMCVSCTIVGWYERPE